MKIIQSNINNLTSLWQQVSEPFKSYYKENHFDYSLIENSEWPNRLWFNQDIDQNVIKLVKDILPTFSTNIIVPYWNIYNSQSFKILEENGFKLKFEQIGMSLKLNQIFNKLEHFKLVKVTTNRNAEIWSNLFKKSFGYYINPILINKTHKQMDYFITYHQNKMVGTGISNKTGNISGIHSVGIIPTQRRKGYAEQIMKLLINQSINTDSDYVTLQASNMGIGLYHKLGFKDGFKIKNYTLF